MRDIEELVEQQKTWHASVQQHVKEHRLVLNSHTDSIDSLTEQVSRKSHSDMETELKTALEQLTK